MEEPPDGMGPVHVPLGHVLANEKWHGSQLAQEMQDAVFFMSPKLIWWQEMATERGLFGLEIPVMFKELLKKTG
uniref:Fanconi anemia core complex-associated protein 24 pseudonuclease domain-containing protein n=1 Tax=Aotus nancymaae TaxID=37293 RepID=A0A2K5D155_AOTNA